jgi:hypothetical protein
MAANINLHQLRVEVALTERDDNNGEAATLDEQRPPPAETTITAPSEQHGQSGDDGSDAETYDSSAQMPQPIETEAPKPIFMRYVIGDTVIMGRPDYMRHYALNNAVNTEGQGSGLVK